MADILYWLHVLHLYIPEIMHPACNYNDVIMSAMTSQITGVSIICSCVGSGADQRKHQSSASLAFVPGHYIDVIMTTMASQITSLTVVYLTVFFRRISKKTSKLRVTGICVGNSPGPVNSPHRGPVTRKMFPFDDVITNSPVTGEFPAQKASNAENVSIWWHHHGVPCSGLRLFNVTHTFHGYFTGSPIWRVKEGTLRNVVK